VRTTSRTAGNTDIKLDVTEAADAHSRIVDYDPTAVVDTAGFHAVDQCKTECERAWIVNASGTYNGAIAADAANAHFVYLSTDYVFPGVPEETPYSENDPVSPCN
jgi:dTDP-4-dehydrorhamnose reductase